MASGCLRNDRTFPTYPEVTCSEGGLLPSDRNSGKSRDTTRLTTESKAATEWILVAEIMGLRLKGNAIGRHWK